MVDKDLYKLIGLMIRDYRKLRGYSQIDFAKKISINRASLSNIEAGKQQVSILIVYKIALAFNVEITQFLPSIKALDKNNSNNSDIIIAQLENKDIDEVTKNIILGFINPQEKNDK